MCSLDDYFYDTDGLSVSLVSSDGIVYRIGSIIVEQGPENQYSRGRVFDILH